MEVTEEPLKRCGKCKQEMPVWMFGKDRSRSDGLYNRCKPCHRAGSKKWNSENPQKAYEWRAANKDRMKKNNDNWLAKNREKNKERCRKWKETNPVQNAASAAAWKAENRERLREAAKIWKQNNRHRATANENRRRAAKELRTPAWLTAEELGQIEMVYLHAKAMTEATGVQHHVDHEIPLMGKLVSGLHVLANLQVITADENFKKHNTWTPT